MATIIKHSCGCTSFPSTEQDAQTLAKGCPVLGHRKPYGEMSRVIRDGVDVSPQGLIATGAQPVVNTVSEKKTQNPSRVTSTRRTPPTAGPTKAPTAK